MDTITGITIDKSYNGISTFAHIDLREHSELKKRIENRNSCQMDRKDENRFK